jgi:N-acetylmuramoyl-L-alanine amidase
MNILHRPLPYADRLQTRPLAQIELLVLHCTELPDLALARKYGEELHYPASQTGNSGHYYVDRPAPDRVESDRADEVQCWVPPERIAHHVAGLNENSIGIELVNRGRWPDWFHRHHQRPTEPYPAAQIELLLKLIAELQRQLPALRWIAGHEDLDRRQVPAADDPSVLIQRKIDPGPLFPWAQVMASVRLQRARAGGDGLEAY